MHTVPPSNLEKSSTCESFTRVARTRRTHVWIMAPSCWNPARSASAPGQTVLSTYVRVQAKARSAEESRRTAGRRVTRVAPHPDRGEACISRP
jgi:hypothetical protein